VKGLVSLKPNLDLVAPPDVCAVTVDVAACGTVRTTADLIPTLRQQPGFRLPPAFLKHADDQTVVGLAAVFQAIQQGGLAGTEFKHWGVLAAPRYLGRSTMAASLQRFSAEGAWGISPHLIPHRSLHSISGTVSQALRIQGPNFGVGGGPNGVVEVLLAAGALMADGRLPGLWLVMTAWDPEPIANGQGRIAPDSQCGAVALAVAPVRAGHCGLRLRVCPSSHGCRTPAPADAELTVYGLQQLLTTVRAAEAASTQIVWALENGGWIEFQRTDVANSPASSERNGTAARHDCHSRESSAPAYSRISSDIPSPSGTGAENQL
jgi:hypothetical protein